MEKESKPLKEVSIELKTLRSQIKSLMDELKKGTRSTEAIKGEIEGIKDTAEFVAGVSTDPSIKQLLSQIESTADNAMVMSKKSPAKSGAKNHEAKHHKKTHNLEESSEKEKPKDKSTISNEELGKLTPKVGLNIVKTENRGKEK